MARKLKIVSYLGLMMIFIGSIFSLNDFVYLGIFLSILCLYSPVSILPVYFVLAAGAHIFLLEIPNYGNVAVFKLVGFLLIMAIMYLYIRKWNGFRISLLQLLIVAFIPFAYIFVWFSSYEGSYREWLSFSFVLLVCFVLPLIRGKSLMYLGSDLINISIFSVLSFGALLVFGGAISLSSRMDLFGVVNPNKLATFISQISLISLGSFFLYGKSKNLIRWLGLLAYFLGAILVLLTGSRSALIATVIAPGLIIFILAIYRDLRYARYYLFFLSTVLFLVCFVFLFKEYFGFFERFSNDFFSYKGDARYIVSSHFVPYVFNSYPLLGLGFGGGAVYNLSYDYHFYGSAHNMIIDIFLQMGLLGLLVFLMFVFYLIKYVVNGVVNLSQIVVLALPFFGGLVNGIGETVFLEPFFWTAICYIIIMPSQKIPFREN